MTHGRFVVWCDQVVGAWLFEGCFPDTARAAAKAGVLPWWGFMPLSAMLLLVALPVSLIAHSSKGSDS